MYLSTCLSARGFVEWVGNTLIFLLAGLIIGGTQEESSIKAADIGYTIILYAGEREREEQEGGREGGCLLL